MGHQSDSKRPLRRYGLFLVQKRRETTIWQWVAGVWLWPWVGVGKEQFYGVGHCARPRKYSLTWWYDG